MNIRDLQADVHQNTREHGWWDDQRTDAELICLCHSELSEALEAVRNDYPVSQKVPAFGNFEEELADCVIRIMDICGARGIDMQDVLLAKHAMNKTRPYKHGGKVL